MSTVRLREEVGTELGWQQSAPISAKPGRLGACLGWAKWFQSWDSWVPAEIPSDWPYPQLPGPQLSWLPGAWNPPGWGLPSSLPAG